MNALSVDVEEYFHAHALEEAFDINDWDSLDSRVDYQVSLTLDILAKHNTKATFFILGYVAKRFPQLIQKIVLAGHEIACHGYLHQRVYEQVPKVFKEDVQLSKTLLEDICARKVLGYRAPSFSINDQCPWAYEVLSELGFKYDSSIYPIKKEESDNSKKPLKPYDYKTKQGSYIRIIPLATLEVSQKRWPAAGGAYWRILPECYNKYILKSIEKEGSSFCCYFHPWELDADQPYCNSLSITQTMRHYWGLGQGFQKRLENMLKSFDFTSIEEAYKIR